MKPVRPTLTNAYSFRLIVFLSCAEAQKSFIWCFWRVQKHEKVSFGVSDVCRSTKKFHFVFLSCAEAWKTSFGLSVVCRSMKKFHLAFLSCAEAWKSFIWCFCRVQKHKKVSFGVSVVCRSMKKQDEFIMLLIFYVFKGRWWFIKISTAHDGLLYNKLSIFTFMK